MKSLHGNKEFLIVSRSFCYGYLGRIFANEIEIFKKKNMYTSLPHIYFDLKHLVPR